MRWLLLVVVLIEGELLKSFLDKCQVWCEEVFESYKPPKKHSFTIEGNTVE